MKETSRTMYKAEMVKLDLNVTPTTIYGVELTPTGEFLKETFPDGSSQTLIVYTGYSTPYGCCRACGDHFIIARYSRYDRIDKHTMEITVDVEDK